MENRDNKFREELQRLAKVKEKKENEVESKENTSLMKKIGANARVVLEIINEKEGR